MTQQAASARLFKEFRRIKTLEDAWRSVKDNGRKSKSKDTRNKVARFEDKASSNLRSLQRRLGAKNYIFPPSRGVLIPREGKEPRPLVVADVEARIVQRAILDVLMDQKAIRELVETPVSFGGIRKRGADEAAAVPGAITAVVGHIKCGKEYFIRSDIRDFFTKIPKSKVLQDLEVHIDDTSFLQIIRDAIAVELENMNQLRNKADLFPLQDIGVSQGCALSPLMGNILLKEFDEKLNEGDCSCIRYIDDFLILGPSLKSVKSVFDKAQLILSSFDMQAYDPAVSPAKAEVGHHSHVIHFLGCEIGNHSVKPSSKNCKKLINSIDDIINDFLNESPSDDRCDFWGYNHTFIKSLETINRVVSGWGNQYYFCNERNILGQLDIKISEKIDLLFKQLRTRSSGMSELWRRRIVGVRSLHDCKENPIKW